MGNISKQKSEDLVAKIKAIRTFVVGATQDTNTANLLTYLSEIEKDIKGMKYGLVFEEHREAIDEQLDAYVPVNRGKGFVLRQWRRGQFSHRGRQSCSFTIA